MPELEQSLLRAIEIGNAALAYPGLPIIAAVAVFIASAFALGRTAGALALNIIAAVAVYWLVADTQARGVSVTALAVGAIIVAFGFALWRINMMARGGK